VYGAGEGGIRQPIASEWSQQLLGILVRDNGKYPAPHIASVTGWPACVSIGMKKKKSGTLLFFDVGNKNGPLPLNVFNTEPKYTGCEVLVAKMVCVKPRNVSVINAPPLPSVRLLLSEETRQDPII
jgi:hypothetical protein